MKRLILLTLLTLSSYLNAQSVDFNITQDVKLATMKDDAGNKPFTPDIRLEFNMNGESFSLGINAEWADLEGGSYFRWGLHSGIITELSDKFKLKPYIGSGVIQRMGDSGGWISFETGFDITYEINEWLSLVSKQSLVQRGDLIIFDDPAASFRPWDWKPNWMLGIKIEL